MPDKSQSGTGLPHSKTLARFSKCNWFRQVLECGSPVPLSAPTEQIRFASSTHRFSYV
jgi:hypothetical protein